MRKILPFLGMAVAAATLQPMNAQTNKGQAAGEYVKNVIPQLFDQVKTISGIYVQRALRREQQLDVRT